MALKRIRSKPFQYMKLGKDETDLHKQYNFDENVKFKKMPKGKDTKDLQKCTSCKQLAISIYFDDGRCTTCTWQRLPGKTEKIAKVFCAITVLISFALPFIILMIYLTNMIKTILHYWKNLCNIGSFFCHKMKFSIVCIVWISFTYNRISSYVRNHDSLKNTFLKNHFC